jgi:hypothetical protein
MKWTRTFGFLFCTLALASLAVTSTALAGDDPIDRPVRTVAPLEIPHATNLELDSKARKRNRKPGNVESMDFLDLTPGLNPVTWPKNSDMRARLLTPQMQRTPIVGWLASNLYCSKKDTGWCLEVDPGEGEYVVFYRLNLK